MPENNQDLLKLVEAMAKALVDEPDQVIVEEFEDEDEQGTMVLELTVAPKDLGKVIGKQGRTAKSMRTILAAAAAKLNQRYVLDIIEEDGDEAEEGAGSEASADVEA
ncbi:MAG TPA: KH domain-containing protein [Terriglobales bacterium]|jgi:hypothetical protein